MFTHADTYSAVLASVSVALTAAEKLMDLSTDEKGVFALWYAATPSIFLHLH